MYLKVIIFHKFEHSSMPIKSSKKKIFGHATAYDTIIILCNSNVSLSLTCPKIREKDSNGYKYLKLSICHKFEHSFLPSLITKLNKNHWTRNYKTYSHHFYKAQYDLCLYLPNVLRNQTTTAENT